MYDMSCALLKYRRQVCIREVLKSPHSIASSSNPKILIALLALQNAFNYMKFHKIHRKHKITTSRLWVCAVW